MISFSPGNIICSDSYFSWQYSHVSFILKSNYSFSDFTFNPFLPLYLRCTCFFLLFHSVWYSIPFNWRFGPVTSNIVIDAVSLSLSFCYFFFSCFKYSLFLFSCYLLTWVFLWSFSIVTLLAIVTFLFQWYYIFYSIYL